jgi:hypothetical protein
LNPRTFGIPNAFKLIDLNFTSCRVCWVTAAPVVQYATAIVIVDFA